MGSFHPSVVLCVTIHTHTLATPGEEKADQLLDTNINKWHFIDSWSMCKIQLFNSIRKNLQTEISAGLRVSDQQN